MKAYIAVPATIALVYRAYARSSLTPVGILLAAITATIHALHPWSLPFVLLCVFFLAGTFVTKVKHAQKAKYTTSSTTGGGSLTQPGPRGAAQVLCNSLPSSVLVIVHLILISELAPGATAKQCLSHPSTYLNILKRSEFAIVNAIPYGIIAHYAAATADTFSSELGILATSMPILLTDFAGLLKFNPKRVPRGTNGGVTLVGLVAGAAGAAIIALTSIATLPYCRAVGDFAGWGTADVVLLVVGIILTGTAGSLLDSLLGAWLQASVIDTRLNKIVEGKGGSKVLFSSLRTSIYGGGSSGGSKAITGAQREKEQESRQLLTGRDILSNNGVNLLMCSILSGSSVGLAYLVYKSLSVYVSSRFSVH